MIIYKCDRCEKEIKVRNEIDITGKMFHHPMDNRYTFCDDCMPRVAEMIGIEKQAYFARAEHILALYAAGYDEF